MTPKRELEQLLADYYASEPPLRAPDRVLHAAFATTEGTRQRRPMLGTPWRLPPMNGYAKALIAAVLIALATVGLLVLGSDPPQPVPHLSLWTPERYAEDWPAPPRSEPAAGAPDVLLVRGDNTHWDPDERAWEGLEYVDPLGDTGSGVTPAIDIREVRGPGAGSARIELAGGVPLPRVDPTVRWMAYGIVVDTDGDGTPDERVGVDNMPDGQHRAWWANLATGETKWKAGSGYGTVYDNGVSGGSLFLDTWYPSASEESDHVTLRYWGTPGRYYAWASLIEGGRVVATDYAPDVGWLVQPEDPGLPLVGTTWIIEREFPSLTVWMWLTFTSDGRLQLDLCHDGDATVQITQDTMRVRDIALTSSSCGAEVTEMTTEMEAGILAVLTADEIAYTVDAGILELSAGSNVLTFVGRPDPPRWP